MLSNHGRHSVKGEDWMFNWLRQWWDKHAVRGQPNDRKRRFPKKPCSVCGKQVAMTKKGLWPHQCKTGQRDTNRFLMC